MYVVLGASGNTGHIVASNLLARGKKVRAVGRNAAHLQPLTAKGAEAFIADVTDSNALAKAFQQADSAYVMIPPNTATTDPLGYANRVSDAIAAAVQSAGTKNVVALSSIGAEQPSGTGPVVGLHNLEQKLNRIDSANVLYLRAVYFMENTLPQAGIIQQFGMMAGPVNGDLPLPMIATRDIGAAAAAALLQLDFTGQQTHELLGPRDLSYLEVARIVGTAIGKPALAYIQLPAEQVIMALTQMGLSKNVATLICEMSDALNSGHMKALEPRSPANTTPTSFETFVQEVFLPALKGQAVSA